MATSVTKPLLIHTYYLSRRTPSTTHIATFFHSLTLTLSPIKRLLACSCKMYHIVVLPDLQRLARVGFCSIPKIPRWVRQLSQFVQTMRDSILQLREEEKNGVSCSFLHVLNKLRICSSSIACNISARKNVSCAVYLSEPRPVVYINLFLVGSFSRIVRHSAVASSCNYPPRRGCPSFCDQQRKIGGRK